MTAYGTIGCIAAGRSPQPYTPFLWMKGEDNETIREELVKNRGMRHPGNLSGIPSPSGFLRPGMVGEPGFHPSGSQKKRNAGLDPG